MAAAGALALATPPAWQPTWPAPSLGAGGAGAPSLPQAGGSRPTALLFGAAPLFAGSPAGDARPPLPGLRAIQPGFGDAVAFLQRTGGGKKVGTEDLDYSLHDPQDIDFEDEDLGHEGLHHDLDEEDLDEHAEMAGEARRHRTTGPLSSLLSWVLRAQLNLHALPRAGASREDRDTPRRAEP